MGKFMKKRGYGARKRRDDMKDNVRLCFNCKSPDYVVADCPYKSDHDDKRKKDKKEKKEKMMTFKKNKKGNGYVVTWDSDGSNDSDDDSSDDEKNAMKKAFASIAISTKPSLFGTSLTCFMAKPTKVQDDSDYDSCASDDDRSDDDDEEEPSKKELMKICEQLGKGFKRKSKECMSLEQELKALRKVHDELQASHECLKEDHEEFVLAHTKLEKAHSTLLELAEEMENKEAKEEQVIVTCDIGLTCDLFDESFFQPIIVGPTNPFCSSSSTTTNSTSTMSDGFTYDASLIVDNKTLKREVDDLTRTL
jgi:hypothetical protein